MKEPGPKSTYIDGFLQAIREGAVAVPAMLMKHYRRLGLSDAQTMLIIHLLTFREKEQKDFPTLEEIQKRMSASPREVIAMLQQCLKRGVLAIEEEIDPDSGIHYEKYDLTPLFQRLAACAAEAASDGGEFDPQLGRPYGQQDEQQYGSHNGPHYGRQYGQQNGQPYSQQYGQPEMAAAQAEDALLSFANPLVNEDEAEIFAMFENEFARPLSPLECEMISSWLDKDGYSKELIIAALKEAVFAGKVYFRYIDRILLEWSRNRISTAEQAKEYTQKFRGKP